MVNITLQSRLIDYRNTDSAVSRVYKKSLKVVDLFLINKVFLLIVKTYALIDTLRDGEVLKRGICDVLENASDLINFYQTYKNIVFWINPLSISNLDEKALLISLKKSLDNEDKLGLLKTKVIAKQIMNAVQISEFQNLKDLRKVIKSELETNFLFNTKNVDELVDNLKIQKKSRSLITLISRICFTFTNTVSVGMTLKRWNIIDLSIISCRIGNQSRVFTFVLRLGPKIVLGTVASFGLVLVLGQTTYQIVIHSIAYHHSKSTLKGKIALDSLKSDLMDFATYGTELASIALPLLVAINPPAVITLAIIAKATGIIVTFLK